MTLSQRPGARFFAAFYRWSRYTQAPIPRAYTVGSRHDSVHARAGPYTSRSFSSARLRRQQGSSEIENATIFKEKDRSLPNQLVEEGQLLEDDSGVGGALKASGLGDHEAVTTEQAHLKDGAILPGQESPNEGLYMEEQIHTGSTTVMEELLTQEEQDINEHATPAALRESVRHIMRHVPSSVAVITVACIESESNSQVPLGIAVSSLSTVTLDPPTISFNVRYPSRTLDAIRDASGRFRVHFLDSDPRGAAIADLFTKGNDRQAFEKRQQAARITLPTSPSPPRILDAAVVAALECKVSQEFTVADHIIVVAEVSETGGQKITKPALSYVQGDYVQKEEVQSPGQKEAKSPTKRPFNIRTHPFYNLRLFPRVEQRDRFINGLKAYLNANPQIFRLSLREADAELRSNLDLRTGTIGISTAQVIAEVAARKGFSMRKEPWQIDLPIKYKFHGQLSRSDIVSIVDSVKQLIQYDISYLSLGQEELFSLLGIDPLSTGMLASDILNPLRDEKIITPFDYANSGIRPVGGVKDESEGIIMPDLLQLERIEHEVRQYLQGLEYSLAVRLSTEELAQNATGEVGWAKTYIDLIQARLYVEAFPTQFDISNFDISGHIGKQGRRIVLRRIFSFLAQDHYDNIKDHLVIPWCEVLRRVNVHPLTHGIDMDFLYNKLKYFLSFAPDKKEIVDYIMSLQRPFFLNKMGMTKLEELAEIFAEKYPHRAITWRRKDWFAALGLSHNVQIKDPSGSWLATPKVGTTMTTLVHAALEKHYGIGKEREMPEVVQYLQDFESRRFISTTETRIRKVNYEYPPAHDAPVSHCDGLLSLIPESLSVIRKHAAAQLPSPEQEQAEAAEDITRNMRSRKPVSDLEHKHVNFAEELLDLTKKSHGFKAYGLDGERKN